MVPYQKRWEHLGWYNRWSIRITIRILVTIKTLSITINAFVDHISMRWVAKGRTPPLKVIYLRMEFIEWKAVAQPGLQITTSSFKFVSPLSPAQRQLDTTVDRPPNRYYPIGLCVLRYPRIFTFSQNNEHIDCPQRWWGRSTPFVPSLHDVKPNKRIQLDYIEMATNKFG